jgi:hypothetical protein
MKNYRSEFPRDEIEACSRRLKVIVDVFDERVGAPDEPGHLILNAVTEVNFLNRVLAERGTKLGLLSPDTRSQLVCRQDQ